MRYAWPLSQEDAKEVVRESFLMGPSLPVPFETENARVWSLSAVVEKNRPAPSVIAIGAFDGVHQGHRKLVSAAVADARSRHTRCSVVTFWPDPDVVLSKGQPARKLLSMPDRVRGLSHLGVDEIVAFDFTPEFSHIGYDRFLCETILEAVKPVSVHVGSDFRMGQDGMGTVPRMRKLGEGQGFDVIGHHLVRSDGSPISATRIRDLLALGEVEDAGELLGRPHFVRGSVEHGRGEGTGMGFPTANVVCAKQSCLPARGVYAGFARVGDMAWPAAINVGAPPTFSGPRKSFLEACLIGFSGDLYDADMAVSFMTRLRPSRVFDTSAELERVVEGNIDWVRTNLGSCGVEVGA